MKKFNEWLAEKITNTVGTMWCAYIFTALALISLPMAIASGNVITIVSWIAQTFLQLVLLAVIQTGQNIIGDRQQQMIQQIEYNTKKTEATAEKIEHIVRLIEKDEKVVIKEEKIVLKEETVIHSEKQ